MPIDSQRELEAVVQAAIRGATVLTGNTRASRFLLAECDKVLRRTGDAWKTPDILPLPTWVQRSFREAQIAGATELVLLNSRQSLSLWKQSITDSPELTELLRPSSAGGNAAQAWNQLHAYRIPLSDSFEATAQAKAFAGWAKRYKKTATRKYWTDGARVADELRRLVAANRCALPHEIQLWGCGKLTPQYSELVEAFRKSGTVVIVHDAAEADWERAQRIACNDSESELRRAAAFARTAVKRDPDVRVGIILPKLREQRSRVQSVFTEVLHPEFYAGGERPTAFEISLGEPLASHALIRTALNLLRFSVEELKFQELKELLLSPYLDGEEQEGAARARLCRWLTERVPEQLSVQRLLKVMNPAEHSPRAAEELRRIFVPKLRRILALVARPEGLPTKAGMSDWATQLGRILRATGWPGEEDKQLSSPNFQAYTKWLELLSDLASLDVTQEQVTLREGVQEIVSAAGAQMFAPENLGAPVQVMDVHEAQGSLFDQLWIGGMNDEAWPPRRSGSAFIPAHLLRAANVPGSTPESQAEEAEAEMQRLLSSAPSVMLSYPMQDGDRQLRMSPGIRRAEEAEWSDLRVENEPTWFERLRFGVCEELIDTNAPVVTDAELMFRGSSLLEKQSACPFRAYAELRLGADEVCEPQGGIEPKIRGMLIEDVLQEFWSHARDLENLRGIGADERKRLIDAAVDAALRKNLNQSESPAEMTIKEIERDRLVELTAEWLSLEEKRATFDMVRHQEPFEHTVAGVKLKGRIDRIDRSVTHLGEIVIDYKAGAGSRYSRKSWEMPRPRLPQLPLYAAYIQSQGRNVVGVGFGILNTAKSRFEGMANDKAIFGNGGKMPSWAKPTLGEQIAAWAQEIERLVKEHLAGEAKVDPKVPPSHSNSSCRYCHLHAMCRVAESVVFDEDDEEENGDE